MTEKVKLPKDVCDALELARKYFSAETVVYKTFRKDWMEDEFKILNHAGSKNIMEAVVIGYEPELTAEEQLKDLYEHPPEYRQEAYRKGIRDALRTQGIHYDWLEDAE